MAVGSNAKFSPIGMHKYIYKQVNICTRKWVSVASKLRIGNYIGMKCWGLGHPPHVRRSAALDEINALLTKMLGGNYKARAHYFQAWGKCATEGRTPVRKRWSPQGMFYILALGGPP